MFVTFCRSCFHLTLYLTCLSAPMCVSWAVIFPAGSEVHTGGALKISNKVHIWRRSWIMNVDMYYCYAATKILKCFAFTNYGEWLHNVMKSGRRKEVSTHVMVLSQQNTCYLSCRRWWMFYPSIVHRQQSIALPFGTHQHCVLFRVFNYSVYCFRQIWQGDLQQRKDFYPEEVHTLYLFTIKDTFSHPNTISEPEDTVRNHLHLMHKWLIEKMSHSPVS